MLTVNPFASSENEADACDEAIGGISPAGDSHSTELGPDCVMVDDPVGGLALHDALTLIDTAQIGPAKTASKNETKSNCIKPYSRDRPFL
jgi:hypothetical protein